MTQKNEPRVPPGLTWSHDADRVEIVRPARFLAGDWAEVELAITVAGRPLAAGEHRVAVDRGAK